MQPPPTPAVLTDQNNQNEASNPAVDPDAPGAEFGLDVRQYFRNFSSIRFIIFISNDI